MVYSYESWIARIAERTDLTCKVAHLTRGSVAALISMLLDRRIRASNPKAAFMHGDRAATCFQDAPLHALCQNVRFEEEYRQANKRARVRYSANGLLFGKGYVYGKGGRPVIYDRPDAAKAYLPKEEWWRIVNFDLRDRKNIVDWTHEREWRVPGDFEFDLDRATVLLANHTMYTRFVKACEAGAPNLLTSVAGLVVMSDVLH